MLALTKSDYFTVALMMACIVMGLLTFASSEPLIIIVCVIVGAYGLWSFVLCL